MRAPQNVAIATAAAHLQPVRAMSLDDVVVAVRLACGSVVRLSRAAIDLKWVDFERGDRLLLQRTVGYVMLYRAAERRLVQLSRHLMASMRPGVDLDGLAVDHADRDPLNNALGNLRIATFSQNLANRGKFRRNRLRGPCASRYKGVSRSASGRRWRAQIGIGGRVVHLGTYDTEEEAAAAYDAAAAAEWGEFAYTNGRGAAAAAVFDGDDDRLWSLYGGRCWAELSEARAAALVETEV